MRQLQPYVPKKLRQHKENPSSLEVSEDNVDSGRAILDRQPCVFNSGKRKLELQESQSNVSELPSKVFYSYFKHKAPAVAVRWSLPYGQLLASSGLDGYIFLYRFFEEDESQQNVENGAFHQGGAKDIQWSSDSHHLLSCGFDGNAILYDINKAKVQEKFQHDSKLTCLRWDPKDSFSFLVGTTNSSIYRWDTRSPKPIHIYKGHFRELQDLIYLPDGKTFISSANVGSRGSIDTAIAAWDLNKGAIISNQIYIETYSCVSLRVHPRKEQFLAQSAGNYMVTFSTRPPYKMDDHKIFAKHLVNGYRIQCDFSHDGNIVATGSADGKVYFYRYRTANLLKTFQIFSNSGISSPVLDVAVHPLKPSVCAVSTWASQVSVLSH